MGDNVPSEAPLFETERAVTLLGGAAVARADLDLALTHAPDLVAADGGAAHAIAAGHMPLAVYGDMDSLGAEMRAQVPLGRLHPLAEQDSTDFDKALRHIRAPLVIALGFSGDRIDHELAVYHGLVARPGARCIVLGGQDLVFHAPPRLQLDLPADTRLSLFPLARVAGQSTGLAWPIDGVEFHPARRIGTSNLTQAGGVGLAFSAPGMLVILPRVHLSEVAQALRAASVWSRAAGAAWV